MLINNKHLFSLPLSSYLVKLLEGLFELSPLEFLAIHVRSKTSPLSMLSLTILERAMAEDVLVLAAAVSTLRRRAASGTPHPPMLPQWTCDDNVI